MEKSILDITVLHLNIWTFAIMLTHSVEVKIVDCITSAAKAWFQSRWGNVRERSSRTVYASRPKVEVGKCSRTTFSNIYPSRSKSSLAALVMHTILYLPLPQTGERNFKLYLQNSTAKLYCKTPPCKTLLQNSTAKLYWNRLISVQYAVLKLGVCGRGRYKKY